MINRAPRDFIDLDPQTSQIIFYTARRHSFSRATDGFDPSLLAQIGTSPLVTRALIHALIHVLFFVYSPLLRTKALGVLVTTSPGLLARLNDALRRRCHAAATKDSFTLASARPNRSTASSISASSSTVDIAIMPRDARKTPSFMAAR